MPFAFAAFAADLDLWLCGLVGLPAPPSDVLGAQVSLLVCRLPLVRLVASAEVGQQRGEAILCNGGNCWHAVLSNTAHVLLLLL